METLPLTVHDVRPAKHQFVSSFVKAGLALLITATVDMIVAFSTGYWATWTRSVTGEYGGYGLWKLWQCSSVSADRQDAGGEPQGRGARAVSAQITTVTYRRGLAALQTSYQCQERLTDFNFPGWYVVTEVFTTLALAGQLACVIMLVVYIVLPKGERSKYIMSAVIGVAYLAGLFLVVALFVFGFKIAEDILEMGVSEWFLSWSFSLACTSFVLNQIGASILVTETKRLFQENSEEHSDSASKQSDSCESEQCVEVTQHSLRHDIKNYVTELDMLLQK